MITSNGVVRAIVFVHALEYDFHEFFEANFPVLVDITYYNTLNAKLLVWRH